MSATPSPGFSFGKPVQVAYLVADVDETMAQWVRDTGVGPWTCIRNIRLEAIYRDKPLELKIHEALSYMGDLQIQLIQSLNSPGEPTPYQPFIEAGRFGMHHMAFFSHDIDADMAAAEAQGFELTCEMRSQDGHRYCYCSSRAMPEVWFELLEVYPLLTSIFEEGIAASASWDGSRPIRNLEYADL